MRAVLSDCAAQGASTLAFDGQALAGIAINSIEQKPFTPDGALVDPSVSALATLQARQIMGFHFETDQPL